MEYIYVVETSMVIVLDSSRAEKFHITLIEMSNFSYTVRGKYKKGT